MIRKFGLLTVAAVGLLTANAYASTDANYYKQETTSNKNGNKSYQVKEEQHDPETGHYKSYSKKENTAVYDNDSDNDDRQHVSVRAKDRDGDYEYKATYNSPSNRNNTNNTYYSSQTTRRNPQGSNLRNNNYNNHYSNYNNSNFDRDDPRDAPHQAADAAMDFHERHKAENLTPSDMMYVRGGWNISKIGSFSADGAAQIADTTNIIADKNLGAKFSPTSFNFSGASLALGHSWESGGRVELEGIMLNNVGFSTKADPNVVNAEGEEVFSTQDLLKNNIYSITGLNVKGAFVNGAYDLSTDANDPVRLSLGLGVGYVWGSTNIPDADKAKKGSTQGSFSSPALRGQLSVMYTAYPDTVVPYLQLSTMGFKHTTQPAQFTITPKAGDNTQATRAKASPAFAKSTFDGVAMINMLQVGVMVPFNLSALNNA